MKISKYMLWTAVALLVTSCSDYLKERSQDTYYITSYEDLDELLIGDCYLPVNAANDLANTSDIGYFIHYLGDEIEEQNGHLRSYDEGNRERIFGYFTWQQRTGETYNQKGFFPENETWKQIYRLINVANNIIESVESVPQNTEIEQQGAKRVKGEAHFLRAAYYFWLVNLYGKPYTAATAPTDLAVPLKTTAKVSDVLYQRNTVQEVYQQVVADLDLAEQLLASTGKAKSIYRADLTAVHFLKSRIYLYMQQWDKAVEYAGKVLEANASLTDFNTLTTAPLSKSSKENIFSMGGAEIPCSMCNFYSSFRVSRDLYNAYDNADLRKDKYWWHYGDFVGYTKVPDPSTQSTPKTDEEYYQSHYHYPMQGQKCEVSDKFLFRTAEAYLIKAEAEAYLGHENEARRLLNELRAHRFATAASYQITSSGQALVKDIREERRLELALEGTRWFDLRRYSVCEKYPESKEIAHTYTLYKRRFRPGERRRYVLQPNDPAYTLPIPNEVIEFNTGMINNERPERSYIVVTP